MSAATSGAILAIIPGFRCAHPGYMLPPLDSAGVAACFGSDAYHSFAAFAIVLAGCASQYSPADFSRSPDGAKRHPGQSS